MENSVIEIKGLTKRYKGFALENLNLELPAGCILGLVGENGAGKSTTIRLIMDAISRDAGQVTVLGVDNRSPDFLRTKEDIGVVLDETCIPEVITAKQLGKIMAGTYRNWDRAAYDKWLDKFQLPPDKKFKDYSRGMAPMVRDELLDVFADFAVEDGHAVLLSSHIVSDLEKICDYIAFLHKGRLVLCEEKDALLDRYGILRCGKGTEVEPEDYIARRKTGVSTEYLVRDRAAAGRKYPKAVADAASLEDIMLFYIKGEAS